MSDSEDVQSESRESTWSSTDEEETTDLSSSPAVLQSPVRSHPPTTLSHTTSVSSLGVPVRSDIDTLLMLANLPTKEVKTMARSSSMTPAQAARIIQRCYRRYHFRTKVRPIEYKTGHERLSFIKEIVQTERTYIHTLEVLVSEYLFPLRKRLSVSDIEAIFGNVEMILKMNRGLYDSLFERRSDPKKFGIGDIFMEFVPFLLLYSTYINNYESSTVRVSELKKSKDFVEFLSQTSKRAGHNFASLMITPVQRIPRYVMLLEGVLKNTEQVHPDYSVLSEVLAKIKKVALQINKNKYIDENVLKLQDIAESFTNINPGPGLQKQKVLLASRTRKFIKEGFLSICHVEGRRVSVFCVLLSDSLIIGDRRGGKLLVKEIHPLLGSKLSRVQEPESQPQPKKPKKGKKLEDTKPVSISLAVSSGEQLTFASPRTNEETLEWEDAFQKTLGSLEAGGENEAWFSKVRTVGDPKKDPRPTQMAKMVTATTEEGASIFIIGGINEAGKPIGDIFRINPKAKLWSQLPSLGDPGVGVGQRLGFTGKLSRCPVWWRVRVRGKALRCQRHVCRNRRVVSPGRDFWAKWISSPKKPCSKHSLRKPTLDLWRRDGW